MENSKTLIFTDLDGTLLDHFTYSFDAALTTIAQLKNANIPIILNTSKTQAELAIIQKGLALNAPFIIENGAAVFIPRTTFKTQPIDTLTVGDYWVKAFTSPREHWLKLLEKNAGQFKTQYKGFSSFTLEELSQTTGLTIEEAKRAKQRQYGEPIQWLGDEENKTTFISLLSYLGANVVQGGRFIHINGHCSKGQALTWLTALYQANEQTTPFTTVALGDGENDVSMLEAADIAVQIRSPVHDFPTVNKPHNTIQTTACGPEGWADALQTLLFNTHI